MQPRVLPARRRPRYGHHLRRSRRRQVTLVGGLVRHVQQILAHLNLALGRAQHNVDEELLSRTRKDMRDLVAPHPTMIELTPDDVGIVAHADPALPPGGCVTLKLPAEARLTARYV